MEWFDINHRWVFSQLDITHEGFIQAAAAKIGCSLRLERMDGVTMDRARFIAEMQDELHALGYEPSPADKGTIRDLSSAGKLGLIWDMQMGFARGYAHWVASFDPDLIEAAPCWELVQLEDREVPREWLEIWMEYGGTLYEGRMIAGKTDEIWTRLSDFGLPWPPFKVGSSEYVRNIRWREAVALGLV